MRAMIMAAGLGTRLLPLTAITPKPMVPILGRPILAHILTLLRRHRITDVVINLHHAPESITSYFGDGREWGMRITYSLEPELLGTAGGVKRNERFLTEDGAFLVVSGDSLMDVDLSGLVTAHADSGAVATLALKEVEDPSQYGVVALDDRGAIRSFQEKPAPGEEISRLCNCGLYILEPDVLQRVPAGVFYDFGRQLWPELLAEEARLGSFSVSGYWNDVGDIQAYRQGSFDALNGRVQLDRDATEVMPGVWCGPRSYVDGGADIEPPVYIGADSRVEGGSRLRGPVVLGCGSVVEEGATVSDVVAWPAALFGRGSTIERSTVGTLTRFMGWVRMRDCVVGERCLLGDTGPIEGASLEPGTVLWA